MYDNVFFGKKWISQITKVIVHLGHKDLRNSLKVRVVNQTVDECRKEKVKIEVEEM